MSGFLKILDPFEHPVQKQQCWNKRGKRGNIKYQSKFLFLPVILMIFTPQSALCFAYNCYPKSRQNNALT